MHKFSYVSFYKDNQKSIFNSFIGPYLLFFLVFTDLISKIGYLNGLDSILGVYFNFSNNKIEVAESYLKFYFIKPYLLIKDLGKINLDEI